MSEISSCVLYMSRESIFFELWGEMAKGVKQPREQAAAGESRRARKARPQSERDTSSRAWGRGFWKERNQERKPPTPSERVREVGNTHAGFVSPFPFFF